MALNDISMSSLVSSHCIEINDLPNEVLTKILEMIGTKSQLSAEQVCQRWHRISDTIFANLKVLRTVVVNANNSDAIKQIGHRFPSLETIDFQINSVSDVISFTLMDSVSKLTNLKVLSLNIDADGQYFDFKSFRCLKHCKTIETLAIKLEEDHDCIEAIAEYMPQIQTLSMQFDFTGDIYKSYNDLLPITRFKQLKRLDILNENCCLSYDCFRHIIDYLNAQKLECVHIIVIVEIADNETLAEATLLLQSNNLYDDIIGVNDIIEVIDDDDVYQITLKRCNNPPECVVSMLAWKY